LKHHSAKYLIKENIKMKKTLLVILALVMALTLVIGPVSMVSATTLPNSVVSGGGSFISGSGWDDGPWAQMFGHSCTFGCNAQIKGSSTDPDALLPAKGNFQFQDRTSNITIHGSFSSGYWQSGSEYSNFFGACQISGASSGEGTLRVDFDNEGSYGVSGIQIWVYTDGGLALAWSGTIVHGALIFKPAN
jgi:hypothetical protein